MVFFVKALPTYSYVQVDDLMIKITESIYRRMVNISYIPIYRTVPRTVSTVAVCCTLKKWKRYAVPRVNSWSWSQRYGMYLSFPGRRKMRLIIVNILFNSRWRTDGTVDKSSQDHFDPGPPVNFGFTILYTVNTSMFIPKRCAIIVWPSILQYYWMYQAKP